MRAGEREVIPAGTRTKVRGMEFMAREAKSGQGCQGCAFDRGALVDCQSARLHVYPYGTHNCGSAKHGIIWKPIIRVMGAV